MRAAWLAGLMCAMGCAVALAQAAEPERSSPEKSPGRWFFYWGTANLHVQLSASEREIDDKLNNTLGLVIPNWKNPITFKDWSDEWRLWEGHAGFGREFGTKFSLFLGGGGAAGTVGNSDDYYSQLFPLRVRAEFTRKFGFAACGLTYYPWNRPCPRAASRGLWRRIAAARPFLEAAVGYMISSEAGEARLGIKDVCTFFRYEEKRHRGVFFESPRIGLELPLGKDDSLVLKAGYSFHNSGKDDLDGPAFYLLHVHKF